MNKEKLENAIKKFRGGNDDMSIMEVVETVGVTSSHPKILEMANAVDSHLTLIEAADKIISLI
jgi:hypothetical protein